MTSKIDLENKIFARAALLRTNIHSQCGALNSAHPDRCLQALIGVYNAFFRRENWTKFCAQEDLLEGYYLFCNSQKHPRTNCCLFLRREYKIELLF